MSKWPDNRMHERYRKMRAEINTLREQLHIAMEALTAVVMGNNPKRTRRALLAAAIKLRKAK